MRRSDIPISLAGLEEAQKTGPACLVEALISGGQQVPGPIQGVDLAASVTEGLVLDPAAPAFLTNGQSLAAT
jgi:hypothetical protein